MSDVMADAGTASSGNPAGRVIKCLAPLINPSQVAIASQLEKVLGIEPSSPRFAVACAELRSEAYGVPARMEKYMTRIPGARRSFDGYQSVRQLADALLRADSTTSQWMLQQFTETGWNALCWADEILTHYEPEPVVDEAELVELLNQVRDLIDQVLECDEFTKQERDHLVSLLRPVEDAVLMVRVHGAGGLERTLKAVVVDVVANADRWGKRGKAVRRVIAAIGGVAVAFFSAYPGAKEFAIDLVRPPAIAATADGATPQDEPVGGPVVDESEGPQEPR